MSQGSSEQTSHDARFQEMREQISFVLDHPGISDWLKCSLRDALQRNPVSVLNDLEILNAILRRRAEMEFPGNDEEKSPEKPHGNSAL